MKTRSKIKIGFFAVLMLLTVALSAPRYFPALVLSVTIHELGHIFVARLRSIGVSEFKLGIFGAAIFPREQLFSYKDEIFLCLGGPAANLLSVAVCLLFKISPSSLFIMSSLALGALNMLPIKGFDGGRILSAFLNMHLSPKAAETVCRLISFIFLFSLWCISVYFLLRRAATLSLFVFSASVFIKIFVSDA